MGFFSGMKREILTHTNRHVFLGMLIIAGLREQGGPSGAAPEELECWCCAEAVSV